MGEGIELDFTDDTEPEDKVIWFGKHKGERLGDLPDNYLHWCIDNLDGDTPGMEDLLDSMQKVLDGRYEYVPDEYEQRSEYYGCKPDYKGRF